VPLSPPHLENPDPLDIFEFAIEHVESHLGSASNFRQARPSWLLLWVNGSNLAVRFSGHASPASDGDNLLSSLPCADKLGLAEEMSAGVALRSHLLLAYITSWRVLLLLA
jgi:hypothetical protein